MKEIKNGRLAMISVLVRFPRGEGPGASASAAQAQAWAWAHAGAPQGRG